MIREEYSEKRWPKFFRPQGRRLMAERLRYVFPVLIEQDEEEAIPPMKFIGLQQVEVAV